MKLIVTDLKKCLGCHSCEIACAVSRSKSKTLLGAILEDPLPAPRVKVISAMDIPAPRFVQPVLFIALNQTSQYFSTRSFALVVPVVFLLVHLVRFARRPEGLWRARRPEGLWRNAHFAGIGLRRAWNLLV